MSFALRSWVVGVAVAVFLVSASAQAESETDAAADEILVGVDGPRGARLEQRVGDGSWTAICTLPCKARVVASPRGSHRIAHGDRFESIPLRSAHGGRLNVDFSPGARTAGHVMLGSSAAVGALGIAAMIYSFGSTTVNALGRDAPECTYDHGCPPDPLAETDRRNGLLFGAGLASIILAGVGAVVGGALVATSFQVWETPRRTGRVALGAGGLAVRF